MVVRLGPILLLSVLLPTTGWTQQKFELHAPELGLRSQAYLTDSKLEVINPQGAITTYARDLQLDSPDGAWIAYRDRRSQQIVRWPVSHSGRMQIGEFQGGTPTYRMSQMQVQASETTSEASLSVSPFEVMPGPDRVDQVGDARLQPNDIFQQVLSGSRQLPEPRMLHLAAYDAQDQPWWLTANGRSLRCVTGGSTTATWWVAPAMQGYVRIQMQQGNQILSLSALQTGLRLEPWSQDPRQLWHVRPSHRHRQRYSLENSYFAGSFLTYSANVGLMLQPLSTASTQLWIPLTPVQPVLAPTLWRSVQRDIRPNPPLPSAQLELVNSHRYALRVLVGDSRKGNQTETVRIEPNSSEQVMLDRDAGSTLVETVEVRSSNGGWDRQTFTTQIPPIGYYDLSVYEEHLQSIAIDRTGKSPNPIEDINYVPRSIGWLSLPVGADLPERGRMDIYNQAKAARNPGAVRRLSLDELEGESERPSPIETILEEFQSVPRRSF